MPKSTHKCEKCGEKTDLRGWYFASIHGTNRLRKQYHWWCGEHWLIHMRNLYPFECEERCRERHSREVGARISHEDSYVWLNLLTTFIPKRPKAKTSRMTPLRPGCPWCGKRMRLV